MAQSASFWTRWKKGAAIGARLLLLGIGIAVLGIPFNLMEKIPADDAITGNFLAILSFAYFFVGIPLILPAVLETCGFTTIPLGGGHERGAKRDDPGENPPP